MIPNNLWEEKSGIFCPVRKNPTENCTGQKILWDVFGCLLATKNKSLDTILIFPACMACRFWICKNYQFRCTNLGASFYHSPDTFPFFFFAFSCFLAHFWPFFVSVSDTIGFSAKFYIRNTCDIGLFVWISMFFSWF